MRVLSNGARTMHLVTLALTAGAASAGEVLAQEITFDSISGDYSVRVTIDGSVETRTLVPANKVALTADVSVEAGAEAMWVYQWTLRLDPGSPQALETVHIPCPESGGVVAHLSAVPDPDDAGPWYASHDEWAPGWVCMFLGGAVPVGAGQTLVVRIETELAPRFGTLAAVGAKAGFTRGFSDAGFGGSAEVFAFESKVSGVTGGWKSVPSLVPGRSRDEVGDWPAALGVLERDVEASCGELAWIRPEGSCAAIGAEVDRIRELVSTGDAMAGRQMLEEIRAMLGSTGEGETEVLPEAQLILGIDIDRLLGLIG